jgi:nuclear pore complex protein Nup98-Nup96
MKFRAVWEDASDTSDEEEVEDNSLLDILPRKLNKGKGRQVFAEDFEDGDSLEDDQSIEVEEDNEDVLPATERRSARALVPTENGDYVHHHEAEHSNTRHTTPTKPGRGSSVNGVDVEEATPPPVPWPAQIGIEPHRVHVMQQSFFRTQGPRVTKQPEPHTKSGQFLLAGGKKRAREPSVQVPEAQHVSLYL